jgi:hypothetical protein
MGFEPTIPVLERGKTVHALDRADTLIGISSTGNSQRNQQAYKNTRPELRYQFHHQRALSNTPGTEKVGINDKKFGKWSEQLGNEVL